MVLVDKLNQPWFPGISVPKVKPLRALPKPTKVKARAVRKYEILYRPFDLRFRSLVGKWIEKKYPKKSELRSRVGNKNYEIIRDYFYPNENGEWINQKSLSKKDKLSYYKIRKILVGILKYIW